MNLNEQFGTVIFVGLRHDRYRKAPRDRHQKLAGEFCHDCQDRPLVAVNTGQIESEVKLFAMDLEINPDISWKGNAMQYH